MTTHWFGSPFTGESAPGQHEGTISLSSIRRPQPDPQPAEVNTHPGPDFAPEGEAA